MFWRVILSLVLLGGCTAWAQVEPSASGGSAPTDDTEEMKTPPPVSVTDYPTEVAGEEESNYLHAGLTFDASYVDNLNAGGPIAVSEKIFTILPTISLDQTRPRQHVLLTYSPGFTFYEPSSDLNQVDQNVKAVYKYLLSPHTSLNATDKFQRSSTAYGLEDSLGEGSVSGAGQPVTPGILAPFAERLTNTADAEFSYQFSRMAMIGASGNTTYLDFPNPAESNGLYNSNERGGGGFFNRRLGASQYVGANYQYALSLAEPKNTSSETQTHSIEGFYSIYLHKTFSISVSSGLQHFAVSQTSLPTSGGWGPSVTASLGWQGLRTSLAASYSRQVTSEGGLVGVFESNSGNLSAHWQMARAWTAKISSAYADNKSITPLSFLSEPGGHSISGQAAAGYTISKELTANFEYDRVHQDYSGITAIANDPNSDRYMVSLAWQFDRPLGR